MKTRAVVYTAAGGPGVIEIAEREVRAPGPGEVLIETVASALNRADILQRRGAYPAPPGFPADIPGLEYAGRVAALGQGVTDVAVGDEVMGIIGGGGMAQHLVAHASEVLPVPAGVPVAEAAAIPEAFLTAYDALMVQGALGMGHTALIHAVGSGVGTAAVQLCRAAGAVSVGTARTQDKLERVGKYGLNHGVLAQDATFARAVLEATSGRGADVILDLVGGSYLRENLKAVALTGHIVVIGLMGGATAEIPLGRLLTRRASLTGSLLRSRPLREKAQLAADARAHVVPLFVSGALRPVIDDVMPMEQVRDAHARMEANETFGKLVLRW